MIPFRFSWGEFMDPTACFPTKIAQQLQYAERFIRELARMTELHTARQFWRKETANMAELGILGTPMEEELRAAWLAHSNALARAANNPNTPAH